MAYRQITQNGTQIEYYKIKWTFIDEYDDYCFVNYL